MLILPLTVEKLSNFKEVFDKGQKYKTSTSHIIFLLERAPNEPHPNRKIYFGVLALKKIVGKKAVDRNKAKRRFKHAFRECLKKEHFINEMDIKIIALTNKNTLSCAWPQLLSDIERAFKFINKEGQLRKC